MHIHHKDITQAGLSLKEAKKVMIMVHGRGANPQRILAISKDLQLNGFALWAPAAKDNTWYPHSFMAPVEENEPSLSSGLKVLKEMVQDIIDAGFQTKDIYFLGFSQGACLSSEYVARNAMPYGGIFIYSGGLIGAELDERNYQGDFAGTPILIGCSDIDAHVPLQRVKATTALFNKMNARVTEQIFPNGLHIIFEDEITKTNEILRQNYLIQDP